MKRYDRAACDRQAAKTYTAAAAVRQKLQDAAAAYAREHPEARATMRASAGNSERSQRIERLCKLYGPLAETLVPELKRGDLSVAAIGALLQGAVGRVAKMTPAGLETFRINAMTKRIYAKGKT